MPLSADLNSADGAAELSPSGPYRGLKQLGLVLLCAAWIVLGLFGHDPWKADDATAFGIAYDMLKHGDWVVPHLAGRPVPDRPPLLYALAAATAWALRGVLPLHDGAHVAVGLVHRRDTVAARARRARTLRPCAFAGCRCSSSSVASACGIAVICSRRRSALLARRCARALRLALALRRPFGGGALLGLAHGHRLSLPRADGRGDHRADRRGAAAVRALAHPPLRAVRWSTAVAVAAPLLVAWPLRCICALRRSSPSGRSAEPRPIFRPRARNRRRVEPLYYLKNLPWFAWPALPLALWTLWVRGRGYNGSLATPGVQLPGVMFCILLIVPLGRAGATGEPRAAVAGAAGAAWRGRGRHA